MYFLNRLGNEATPNFRKTTLGPIAVCFLEIEAEVMIELVLIDQSSLAVYVKLSLALGRFYTTYFVCTGEVKISIPWLHICLVP